MRTLIIALCLALPAAAQEQSRPFANFDIASEPVLDDPHDLEIGPDGRLYVADKFGARIVVLDPETLEVVEILAEGTLPNVRDISFAEDGSIAVAVTGEGKVFVYDAVEALTGQNETYVPAPETEGALMHSNGDLYASSSGNAGLARFHDREFVVASAPVHPGIHDVVEASDGTIWVADNVNRRLVRFSEDLEMLQVVGHRKFGFQGPRYMDITEAGHLVVADQDAHRILFIDPDGPDGGTLLGVLGDGTPGLGVNRFDDPEGVEIDGARIYLSDSDNNRIVRYVFVTN